MTNERDGITHDYSRKSGVVHSEIMLPDQAPMGYNDRSTLWNEVERIEKRKDAQTAREIEVALPAELSTQEQKELLRDYIKDNFTSRGMCADFSIHDKKDGNPHAHILLTTRDVNAEGFQGKNRSWNGKAGLQEWREKWAVECNRVFEKKNIPERIDHRTLQAQGIEREPTIHKGAAAHQMEKRGKTTDRGKHNQEVRLRNMAYKRDFDELQLIVDEFHRHQLRQQQQQQQQEQEQEKIKATEMEKKRAEEQEARNKQHSSGEAREGQPAADPRREMARNLDDLYQEPKPEKKPTKPVGSSSTEGVEGAERVVERLQSLKADYMRLEQQMRDTKAADSVQRDAQREIESRAEQMAESANSIEHMTQRMTQLQQERNSLGRFKGKEKKSLDEQIERLQHSKEQASDTFRRDYGIEPEKAAAEIDRLKKQQAKGKSMNDWKHKIEQQKRLEQHLQGIEIDYKTQLVLAAIHPDRKEINELLSRVGDGDSSQSIQERIAKAQIENRLNKITKDDYKEILQRANVSDAQRIFDYAKAHAPEQGRSSPTHGSMEIDR